MSGPTPKKKAFVEADDGTEYQDVFSFIINNCDDDDTIALVESLDDSFEVNKRLTEKQHLELMKIWHETEKAVYGTENRNENETSTSGEDESVV